MRYYRVIPRDLFNEAKLLKCLGQLSLIAHDYPGKGIKMELSGEEEGFRIEQDESSGALYCSNLECFVAGRLIGLRGPYNNKAAFPLQFVIDDDEGRVFNEDGSLSDDFKAVLASIQQARA
jgi:hypothetical protein